MPETEQAPPRTRFVGDFLRDGEASTKLILPKREVCDRYTEFTVGRSYKLIVSTKGGLHLEVWPIT